MNFTIKKAVKYGSKLRAAFIGISGSGKTYTSLLIAKFLGEKICLIDTEGESASKYADIFNFDTIALDTFSPTTYAEALRYVEAQGYDVCIIDSLSHAWMGKDGALDQVDKAAKRSQSNNSYVAWRDVTPKHNELVDTMVRCKMHLIVTMRAKQEYVIEKDEKTGKSSVRKLGLAPIQREGLEYEFDVVGDMDLENNYIISKTRCSPLNGAVINKPGESFANTLIEWLDGEVPPPAPPKQPAPETKNKNAKPRDFKEESKNFQTLDELGAWWKKLNAEEKIAAQIIKDAKKKEIEDAQPKVESVKIIDDMLSAITAETKVEDLEKIDTIIDTMKAGDAKKNYIELFSQRLVECGLTYDMKALPF